MSRIIELFREIEKNKTAKAELMAAIMIRKKRALHELRTEWEKSGIRV